MSVVMANHSTWDSLNHGRPGFIRFGGYLGLILGAVGLAAFGQGGYNQDAYLFQLIGSPGLMWCGTGAILGARSGWGTD